MTPKILAFLNRFRAPLTGLISDRTVVLDNLTITNAKLIGCTLLYGGGTIRVNGLQTDSCKWSYFGAAANTLTLMRMLDQCGAADLISNTFPGAILHDRKQG
jgi:hypothetical protein